MPAHFSLPAGFSAGPAAAAPATPSTSKLVSAERATKTVLFIDASSLRVDGPSAFRAVEQRGISGRRFTRSSRIAHKFITRVFVIAEAGLPKRKPRRSRG